MPLMSLARKASKGALLAALASLYVGLFIVAGPALADSAPGAAPSGHDMSQMPGHDMQQMPGHDTQQMPGHDMQQMPGHDMSQTGSDSGGHGHEGGAGHSANWYVVGGFVALIGSATVGAAAMKKSLAAKIATGQLARAGVRDV